jgi:uncharacterized protein (DUF924 family)
MKMANDLEKENKPKFDQVLKFWFGDNVPDLNSDEYKHNQQLWFELKAENDERIKDTFSSLHVKAANGELDFWDATLRGKLALIIVFSQFSRSIYRGLSDQMFKHDQKAIELANRIINEDSIEQLACIEKYFVYFPLLQSENLTLSKFALDQIEKLSKQAPNTQKEHFFKYFKASKLCTDLLTRFGRYPNRNKLLGRESTREETEYLSRTRNYLINSVQVLKKKEKDSKSSEQIRLDKRPDEHIPFQNILFLQ